MLSSFPNAPSYLQILNGEEIIAYERTSHPSDIKTWTPVRFVA